jgi:HD-GYP domain-containing protein (c-di-GMP phosphodiesterase class II)
VAGLKGEGIPLGARVLAVADAYVSMTSPRAYRTAFTVEEALAELADKSGSQFDPDVVGALRRLIAEEVARPAG